MKKELSLQNGRAVLSKAGRDKGKIFLIVDIIDAQYVLIADGYLRKSESPKKKKIKHLKLLPFVSNDIFSKIEQKQLVLNHELKECIQGLEFQVSIGNKEEIVCQNKM